jgi:hypothetical protein
VAELDVERKKATNQSPSVSREVEEVARVLLDRMEKSDSKDKWDTGGSATSRASAFLSWLENEPKRLMSKFKSLVYPLADFIRGYPAGEKLLKFVGIGKNR